MTQIRNAISFVRFVVTVTSLLCSCEKFDPKQDEEDKVLCCGGLGQCLSESLIRLIHQDLPDFLSQHECDTGFLCAPDINNYIPTVCRSVGNSEGRCASLCLPDVAAYSEVFPQDVCPINQRCVPCYDPLTETQTPLCNLPHDPQPFQLPQDDNRVRCCNNLGRCFDQDWFPPEYAEFLEQEVCPSGQLCLPDIYSDFRNYVPTPCITDHLNGEGRCAASCLPEVEAVESFFGPSTCPADQRCIPCYDPFTRTQTSLCNLPNDPQPFQPPQDDNRVRCCNNMGRCFDQEWFPPDYAEFLGQEVCPLGQLCLPDVYSDFLNYVPTPCITDHLNSEGRCAASCLPEVEAVESFFGSSTCPADQRCIPCYDPFARTQTSLCNLPNDPRPFQPPQDDNRVRCCNNLGRCFDQEWFPPEYGGFLGQEACPPGQLCLPDVYSDFLDYVPTPCITDHLNSEGRCAASCLPEVEAVESFFGPSTCPADQRCIPCYDPFTRTQTSLCNLPNDPQPFQPPQDDNRVRCCNNLGRCFDQGWFPSEYAGFLGQEVCPTGQSCLPDIYSDFLNFVPTPCTTESSSSEGRCAARCLPEVAAMEVVLGQAACPADQLCVPCTNIITGERTGVCDMSADLSQSR